MNTKVTLLLCAMCLAAASLFGMSDITSTNAMKVSETHIREIRDFTDLLRDLVFLSPSPLQDEMNVLHYDMHMNIVCADTPDPGIAAHARAEAHSLYKKILDVQPTISVEYNGEKALFAENAVPLSLTRGLRYVMLVEIQNTSDQPIHAHASVRDYTTQMAPSLLIEPGEQRPLWVVFTMPDKKINSLTIDITRTDKEKVFSLSVPVTSVEPAIIKGFLCDEKTGKPTPGRLYVEDADGVYRRALPWGENGTLTTKPLLNFIYSPHSRNASYTTPFFYCDGTFELYVPPGKTTITMERGFEHAQAHTNITLTAGEKGKVSLTPNRIQDMRAHGWVSGDTHVHWAKNNWYENEDMDLLKMVQLAEDIRVINNLTLLHSTGTSYFIAPTQFPMGPAPGYCDDNYHIEMAEEYRNEEYYGHINVLNITNIIQPISTGSINVPPHWDYPVNAEIFHKAHAQGGIVCEAHGLGPNNDVPVNVILGLSDALDQIEPVDYYRFLECGVRIPLGNGSDHPARITGCVRTYVKNIGTHLYKGWIDGIRSNRTFVTSGPLIFLSVNGKDIGDVLNVSPDTELHIEVKVFSRHPIGTVQIVSNSDILSSTTTEENWAVLDVTIPAGESRWIVARCSQNDNYNVLLAPNAAHTSAVYIDVNGEPRINPAAAREWINRMTLHRDDLQKNGRFEHEWQRKEAVAHVQAGIDVYTRLLPETTNPVITLTPVQVDKPLKRSPEMPNGNNLSSVRFLIQADWMSAPIHLRFPEVLRSIWGVHFLDHYLTDIEPLSEWNPFPQWQKDEKTGKIWYDFTTPEGLQLIASATPVDDEVHLEYTVVNQSTQAISFVEPNCCLNFKDCPEMNDANNTSNLYAMLDGKWMALRETTPTAEEMGRTPWLVLTRDVPKPDFNSPSMWCVDQTVTENLMGAVTRDKAHLVGYTWDVEPKYLMSNCGYPCLHTGAGSSPEIKPGESYTWYGRIYCIPNNPRELLRRYYRDKKIMKEMKAQK